jgi:hypothetical protein
MSPSLYPLGRSPRWGWVGPRAGLDDVEKRKFFALQWLELQPLARLARSQSLCWLRYPGFLLGLIDATIKVINLIFPIGFFSGTNKEMGMHKYCVASFRHVCVAGFGAMNLSRKHFLSQVSDFNLLWAINLMTGFIGLLDTAPDYTLQFTVTYGHAIFTSVAG